MKKSIFLNNIVCLICALSLMMAFNANAQSLNEIKAHTVSTTSKSSNKSSNKDSSKSKTKSSSKKTSSSKNKDSDSSSKSEKSSKSKKSTSTKDSNKSTKSTSTSKKSSSTKNKDSNKSTKSSGKTGGTGGTGGNGGNKGNTVSPGNGSNQGKASSSSTYFDIEDNKYNTSFSASGGTDYFYISTNSSSWHISTNTLSWAHLTKDGNRLTLSVDANNSTSPRSDYFVITNDRQTRRVDFTQQGCSTTLSLSTTSLSFDANGGTRTINVNSNTNWRVGAAPASWGHYSISGNQLTFKADPNNNSRSREDYFTIVAGDKSVKVNVYQKKESMLSLSTENLTVAADGETKYIIVDAGGDTWDIGTSTNSWGRLSKSGNSITIAFDPNTSPQSRTDYFTVKSGDKTVRVNITQNGKSSTTSSYTSSYNSSSTPSSYSSGGSKQYGYDNYYYSSDDKVSRFSVGIEIFGDISVSFSNKNEGGDYLLYNYGAGLMFRIGRFSDIINFTFGGKWMGVGLHDKYGDSDGNMYNYIIVPGNLKINTFRIGDSAKFYLGGGFEYGFGLKDAPYIMDWNAGIGINSRHVDWYVFFKQFLDCKGENLFDVDDNKNRIGTSLTFYF